MSHHYVYVLVPKDTEDIEGLLTEMLAPFDTELPVAAHRRECDCLLSNAAHKAEELSQWNSKGFFFEFTKREFHSHGFELAWRRAVLELGTPDPDCEECDGTGFRITQDNTGATWDGWEIGLGNGEDILNGCRKRDTEDPNIVALADLDIDRIPLPDHILVWDERNKDRLIGTTIPDHVFAWDKGRNIWLSKRSWVWRSTAVVVDEDWEQTVKQVLSEHEDFILVVIDVHI